MIEQRLDQEDLEQWWKMQADDECLDHDPGGWFTKSDAWNHYMGKFRLIKKISEKYGLPIDKRWGIDQSTGGIMVYDE